MGWIDDLRGEIVAIDTSPVIYFIVAKPIYVGVIRPFFQAMDAGDITAVTSIVTLLEVLVHPCDKVMRRWLSSTLHSY